jgi:hypothetical protein
MASEVLVVWKREPNGFDASPTTPLQAAILHTASGTFERFTLPLAETFYGLAVATNGSSWLVADGPSFVAISRAGVVLTPVPVRYTSYFPGSISIASDGTRYLLAWEDESDPQRRGVGPARFTVVNGDGTIAVPEQAVHPKASSVAATFTGPDYLVASTDLQQVRVSRVSTAGSVLSTGVIATLKDAPLLAPLGTGALLMSQTFSAVRAVRLSAEGALVDAQPFALPFLPNVFTTTPRRTILNLRTSGASAAVQELSWSTPNLRRSVSHP